MKNRMRLPPLNAYTVRLYWIGLTMGGIALLWSFYYQWPPMSYDDKIGCTVFIIIGCAGFLYRGISGAEYDRLIGRFRTLRAAMGLGAPVPDKHSGMWLDYRAGLCNVMLDMMSHFWFCAGCMKKMPWGWLAVLMHVLFSSGVGILKAQKPEWFDGSDPDLAGTAYLTLPALDFTIGGIIAFAAWFF